MIQRFRLGFGEPIMLDTDNLIVLDRFVFDHGDGFSVGTKGNDPSPETLAKFNKWVRERSRAHAWQDLHI